MAVVVSGRRAGSKVHRGGPGGSGAVVTEVLVLTAHAHIGRARVHSMQH